MHTNCFLRRKEALQQVFRVSLVHLQKIDLNFFPQVFNNKCEKKSQLQQRAIMHHVHI